MRTYKTRVVIALAVILLVSVFLSAFIFFQYQSVLQAKNELNQQLVSVQNQLSDIQKQQQTDNMDEEMTEDFNLFYEEFGGVSIQSRSYNFSPPVSIYRALRLALESDNWTSTSLTNVTVQAYLEYCMFWRSNTTITNSPYDNSTITPSSGFEVLYEVTQPVNDYSPAQSNETTYRYIWSFVVVQINPSNQATMSSLGHYWVDAATAELITPSAIY